MKMKPVRKVFMATVTRAPDGDLEFVLSDETKDRMGDVIKADGWDLRNFRSNPIALFNHNSSFPIGNWQKVRVDGKRLIGKLKTAAEGTSDRIDEIIRLLEQGVLRAVSVGFMPIDMEPLADNSGILFKEQELLEASVVSVPANPSAVQLARSLHTSDETIDLVFGKNASNREPVRRGDLGGHAVHTPQRGILTMKTLAQRIEEAQARLVALRDQLTQHLEEIGDGDADETQSATTDDLNIKIAATQKTLDQLRTSEQLLVSRSVQPMQAVAGQDGDGRRPFAQPATKVKPQDYVWRSLVVAVKTHCDKHRRPMIDIMKETYGDDEATKAVMDVVTRTATVPADTVTSGWASQLVNTAIGDFFDALMPQTVYPGLSARGGRFTFGRNGIVSLPSRATTPTIAGSFVGQGSPIPVRQGAFSAVALTPKKMGVISTFTREIAEHSTPSIEALIRQAVVEDTGVAIDSVLLDAVAASTIRPAGLRNGVAAITATAGGGFAALVADVKALVGALVASTNGNIRMPVWIMNPIQVLSIALTQNAGGDFPFAAEVNQNRLQGYPILQSTSVTAGMILLVDAADFFSATGDEPRFDVSDQAVLHMEDTTPLAIGTAGAPATVAAPARSLWQTDTLAVRMLLDINWALRRAGVIAWTQTVTW